MTKEEIQKNSEHWYNKYKDAENRITDLENQIADIKANCDLAIEGRDIKIKELEQQIEKMKCCGNCANLCRCGIRGYEECKNYDKWEIKEK